MSAVNVRATKIEFSVPTSDIAVPDLQKEIKQDAKAALKAEIDFKSGPSMIPTPAPVVVATPDDRATDPFASKDKQTDRDDQSNRKDRSLLQPDDSMAKRNAMMAEQYKAAKANDPLRTDDSSSLSRSSWQVNRRDAERDSDSSSYNTRERSVGWSTLFKDAQEERDRKAFTSRMNEFKALYDTPNSIAPIGTPAANSNPMKDALWHEPGMNPQDGRTELLSRRDDPQYAQPLPGTRGGADTFDAGPSRSEFQQSELAPVREFEQHRGVLEMPKRPGDLLK